MRKKKIVFILVIALVLLGAGVVAAHEWINPKIDQWLEAAKKTKSSTSKTVVAVVDGEKLYQENIDAAVIAQEIIQENTGETKSVDSKEVLEEQIRMVVTSHEAVKLGLEADYETAKAEIEESYRLVMEENGENAAFLQKYMKELELTKAEYIEAAAKTRQNSMTRGNLYSHFTKEMKGTEEEKKAAYEEYVDGLVEKADIQILSK